MPTVGVESGGSITCIIITSTIILFVLCIYFTVKFSARTE